MDNLEADHSHRALEGRAEADPGASGGRPQGGAEAEPGATGKLSLGELEVILVTLNWLIFVSQIPWLLSPGP